jgi:23S rRNA G2445 N2-methylase RlmL
LIGGDLEPKAISIAKQNLRSYDNIQLYRWDAASLPLPSESVSVVVANLPFGRRVGNHEANIELYPRLVQEILRVLKAGGRAVLLTQEATLLFDTIKSFLDKWTIERDHRIEMGGLTPHIVCLRKRG